MDIKYAVENAHDENILTHELPLDKEVRIPNDDCQHQIFKFRKMYAHFSSNVFRCTYASLTLLKYTKKGFLRSLPMICDWEILETKIRHHHH